MRPCASGPVPTHGDTVDRVPSDPTVRAAPVVADQQPLALSGLDQLQVDVPVNAHQDEITLRQLPIGHGREGYTVDIIDPPASEWLGDEPSAPRLVAAGRSQRMPGSRFVFALAPRKLAKRALGALRFRLPNDALKIALVAERGHGCERFAQSEDFPRRAGVRLLGFRP